MADTYCTEVDGLGALVDSWARAKRQVACMSQQHTPTCMRAIMTVNCPLRLMNSLVPSRPSGNKWGDGADGRGRGRRGGWGQGEGGGGGGRVGRTTAPAVCSKQGCAGHSHGTSTANRKAGSCIHGTTLPAMAPPAHLCDVVYTPAGTNHNRSIAPHMTLQTVPVANCLAASPAVYKTLVWPFMLADASRCQQQQQ